MLKEKVQPYLERVDNGVLSQPIIIRSPNLDQKVSIFPLHFHTFFFSLVSLVFETATKAWDFLSLLTLNYAILTF